MNRPVMSFLFFCLSYSVSGFGMEGFFRPGPDSPKAVKLLMPSIIKIEYGRGEWGTGFFVRNNTILTNAHVVDTCQKELSLDRFSAINQKIDQPCPTYKVYDSAGDLISNEVFIRKTPRIVYPGNDFPESAFVDFDSFDRTLLNYVIELSDFALIEIPGQNIHPIVQLDPFDSNRDRSLMAAGFPMQLKRTPDDRAKYAKTLSALSEKELQALIRLKQLKTETDWAIKSAYCQKEIPWSPLPPSWKTGFNKAVHEGDRVTCEELIDHEIKLKQNWIDEYANRITRMQSLPVVAPTDYDMPDGALRLSKGKRHLPVDSFWIQPAASSIGSPMFILARQMIDKMLTRPMEIEGVALN